SEERMMYFSGQDFDNRGGSVAGGEAFLTFRRTTRPSSLLVGIRIPSTGMVIPWFWSRISLQPMTVPATHQRPARYFAFAGSLKKPGTLTRLCPSAIRLSHKLILVGRGTGRVR